MPAPPLLICCGGKKERNVLALWLCMNETAEVRLDFILVVPDCVSLNLIISNTLKEEFLSIDRSGL